MDETLEKYLTRSLDGCVKITTEMIVYGDTEVDLEELVQDALDEGFISVGPSYCIHQDDGDLFAQFVIHL